jgi:hypothetical protein
MEKKSSRDDLSSKHDVAADEDLRKRLRWLLFAKSKVVFGFDHVQPQDMPSMTSKFRGVCLSFESILNWPCFTSSAVISTMNPPPKEISIQISLSMFHLKSKSFFGSTWMGKTVAIVKDPNNQTENIAPIFDVEYSDLAYFVTRVTDPGCVLVMEVVGSVMDGNGLISCQVG